VRLVNGDGGEDDNSLDIYVASTIPQIPLRGKPIFRAEGKRETSNFRCVLAGLVGAVRNQIFRWANHLVCLVETRIYSVF
jgi:hypothetical protein